LYLRLVDYCDDTPTRQASIRPVPALAVLVQRRPRSTYERRDRDGITASGGVTTDSVRVTNSTGKSNSIVGGLSYGLGWT